MERNGRLNDDFIKAYACACSQQGLFPSKAVKCFVCTGISVLDIRVDRVKLGDWKPVLAALKDNTSLQYVSLQNLQSFEGDGKKKPVQVLPEPFVRGQICSTIGGLLQHSPILQYLELKQIPLQSGHLQLLSKALAENKTLMSLSMETCHIGNAGFQVLCKAMKNCTRLSTVIFTECNLTWKAMENLAKLIQHQATMRHELTWVGSLRCQKPELTDMNGLRCISLNDNPGIGDRGAILLANALTDDLWITCVYLRHCGISDEGAIALLSASSGSAGRMLLDISNNPVQDEALMQHPLFAGKRKAAECCQNRLPAGSDAVNSCKSRVQSRSVEGAQSRRTRRLPNVSSRAKQQRKGAGISANEIDLEQLKKQLEQERSTLRQTELKLLQVTEAHNALTLMIKSSNDERLLKDIEGTFMKFQEFLTLLQLTGLGEWAASLNRTVRPEDSGDGPSSRAEEKRRPSLPPWDLPRRLAIDASCKKEMYDDGARLAYFRENLNADPVRKENFLPDRRKSSDSLQDENKELTCWNPKQSNYITNNSAAAIARASGSGASAASSSAASISSVSLSDLISNNEF